VLCQSSNAKTRDNSSRLLFHGWWHGALIMQVIPSPGAVHGAVPQAQARQNRRKKLPGSPEMLAGRNGRDLHAVFSPAGGRIDHHVIGRFDRKQVPTALTDAATCSATYPPEHFDTPTELPGGIYRGGCA